MEEQNYIKFQQKCYEILMSLDELYCSKMCKVVLGARQEAQFDVASL